MNNRIVLQFTPYYPPHMGGLENYAAAWSRAFLKYTEGKVVNITFSPGQTIQSWSYQHSDGYPVQVLPAIEVIPNYPFPALWSPRFWRWIREIRKIIEWENKENVCIQTHTRFFLSSLLWGIIARRFHLRWIHIEHGSGPVVTDRWLVRAFSWLSDRLIGRWIFRRADELVAISQACADFVERESGRKACVLYRGLEMTSCPRITRNDEIIRLAYVGRLVDLKGVSFLLRACALLIQDNICWWSLRIAGDGPEREKLESLVVELGLRDFVTFLGSISHDQVQKTLLPSTDIFINPSLQEGLPTTVIEALIAGCVVVATDVGGTREIGEKGDVVLVSPSDSESLKKGIEDAFGILHRGFAPSKRFFEQFDERRWMRDFGE